MKVLCAIWKWTEADRQFGDAIALSPSDARIRAWYGQTLAVRGRFAEALEQLRAAERLDPLATGIMYAVGEVSLYAGQPEVAIVQGRRLLELDRDSWGGHNLIARGNMDLGRLDDARAALTRSRGELWSDVFDGVAAGDREGAHAVLTSRLQELADRQPFTLASLLVATGDLEQGMLWLRRAYDARQFDIVSLAVDRSFVPLRKDPRSAFVSLSRPRGCAPPGPQRRAAFTKAAA